MLYSFGNISIISGITQIDWCKVTCVYSKCRDHSYKMLYFTLDYHTNSKEKLYLKYVNDTAIQQINLKKETWTVCVLVCQPVIDERGTFWPIPHKLHRDQDLPACWAEGKLHVQATREKYGSTLTKLKLFFSTSYGLLKKLFPCLNSDKIFAQIFLTHNNIVTSFYFCTSEMDVKKFNSPLSQAPIVYLDLHFSEKHV
jgi:hypothetical protein